MINWTRVRELEDDIGAEDIGEVVEIFFDEVEEVINDLRRGNIGRDLEADMHFLKGSALNLGFDRLGRLCSDGEKLAANGQDKYVPVSQILSVYDASKIELLGQLAAA